MARKAPRLLALLVSSVWFLARTRRSAADRRHRLPRGRPDGHRGRPGLRLRARLQRHRPDRGAGRRHPRQPGRHEPAPPRRPRDLPELRQQRHPESRVPLVVPGARRLQRRPAHRLDPASRSRPASQQFTIAHRQRDRGQLAQPGALRLHRHSRHASGLEGANGSFPVSGWAVDDVDIDHIDFLVDGQIVAGAVGRGEPSSAIYGTTRPDVAAAFPDLPLALYSGFSRQHRHDPVHQRHPRPVGPRDRHRRRVPGARASHRPDRQQRLQPRALRPHRLPARQGLAVLHRRSPAVARRPARPTSAATS